MPAPRSMARFNRRFANPVLLQVAGRLPWLATVNHVGRRSGRVYRTPVMAFRHERGYLIALTYGPNSDWVQNVRAAGSCELLIGGRLLHLADPQIETDEDAGWAPFPVKLGLRLLRAPQYLRLSFSGGDGKSKSMAGANAPVAGNAKPTSATRVWK